MSAPWEVWTDRAGTVVYLNDLSLEDKRFKPFTRYLRADLTCGECAEFGETYDEAQGTNCHRKHDSLHRDADPACVAFTPKERKP